MSQCVRPTSGELAERILPSSSAEDNSERKPGELAERILPSSGAEDDSHRLRAGGRAGREVHIRA